MTNWEYYKGDATVLSNFFHDFCNRKANFNPKKDRCSWCRVHCCENHHLIECSLWWAAQEHKDNPPKMRRRPYTFDEAELLLGRSIVVAGDNGEDRMCVSFYAQEKTVDGVKKVLVCGMEQEDLIAKGATLDGDPFGVEEEVADETE